MEVSREVGQLVSKAPGPTLVAVGGIHGNERAGIHAARRIFERFEAEGIAFTGEILALAGNVSAIAQGRRFISYDLNRVWEQSRVDALDARTISQENGAPLTNPPIAEHYEQRALLTAIRAAISRARGPVYLIDLHSTSAAGVPFIAAGTSRRQRAFIEDCELPLPSIIGLEEKVVGALSAYWNANGCTAITVEGGQHDDPATVDNLEAVLLLVLQGAGIIERGLIPEAAKGLAMLDGLRGDLPRFMEVISRFAITPDQGFTMAPGFRNVDFARMEQLLAHDKNGEIRAKEEGIVILPLYQGQGNEGFFWGRALESPSRATLPPSRESEVPSR